MMDLLTSKLTDPVFLSIVSFVWYQMGKVDCTMSRISGKKYGLQVAQVTGRIPGWNSVVEPMLLKQFLLLFTFCNSFIDGLISDNLQQDSIQETLHSVHRSIVQEVRATDPAIDEEM